MGMIKSDRRPKNWRQFADALRIWHQDSFAFLLENPDDGKNFAVFDANFEMAGTARIVIVDTGKGWTAMALTKEEAKIVYGMRDGSLRLERTSPAAKEVARA